jgi:guanine deaminase
LTPEKAPARAAYRARLLTFRGDPALDPGGAVFEDDGLLVVANGRVVAAGAYAALAATLDADTGCVDLRPQLIVPGFIDAHIHYPQTEIVASPASGLLPWLENWTFPAESRFGDAVHAARIAEIFFDELLGAGTTTAVVYCTVHPESAEAFFAASHARGLRMVAGKVMMDRNCPGGLRDTAQRSHDESAALIQRWHGAGRQSYAITPRFVPTSSPAQLEACGALARAHPDVFVQTHVAENLDEIRWVRELFPGHRSYLDVYDHYGLVRPRAVFGHCIHLDDADRARMASTGAVCAHCATSNLFLGSGLFEIAKADATGMRVALGTDIGGGTSFSMLQTMNETHKVARMTGRHLSATRMFWLATTGAARALGIDALTGTLAPGSEADFTVLDAGATPLLARRAAAAGSLEELLFAFALLGDDRAVASTYATGRCVHRREARMAAA